MKKCPLSLCSVQSFYKTLTSSLGLAMMISVLALQGCTSSDEDDASLEATEPVEAAPTESSETGAEVSAPAESIAPSPSDGALVAPADQPPAAPTEVVPPTPPSSVETSGQVMDTSRRVLYVKVDTAVIREQPDVKSKVVGKAHRGDHFLVSIDGEWAKTSDGKFISMKVLSERAVGREKKPANWGQGDGQQEEKPKSKRRSRSKSSNTPGSTSGPYPPIDGAAPAATGSPAESGKPAPADAQPSEPSK